MDELIKLVRNYRLDRTLSGQNKYTEAIIRIVEPKLSLFVFKAIRNPSTAEDVLQEVLKGIVVGLPKFSRDTEGEFWGWCYTITRNKINDHYRSQAKEAERIQPISEEEFWELAAAPAPLSAGDRLDFEYVMKLLKSSKPDCYDYLLKVYILGVPQTEIAEEENLKYDTALRRIDRCIELAQELVK